MQRAASLVPLAALVAELGADIDDVLDGTGVSVGDLRPDVFIPYATYLAILDNAVRVTRHDDFGLLLGSRQTLAALGPLGRVMRHAATLGEALAEFAAFQIHNSSGGTVYLIRADRDAILGYGVYDPSMRASPHIHDVIVAVGSRLVTELTRGRVEPEEFLSLRAAPADLRPYRMLGSCPIRFGQSQTGMVFGAAKLGFRLPEADGVLHRAALAELAPGLAAARSKMRGLVPHVLRHLMMTGQAGMEDVAAHVGIHPRSLRRRLREEGTTFEEIKDEVRYAVARELLRLGALNMTDIALTLDYSSASAFDHAFMRWSGTSPTRWRDANAGQAGIPREAPAAVDSPEPRP
ncbi:MAG: AraC family transcriptional regulator ligand-binding domain-containing protein [Bauldia sp.]|nr:AraC family transcriptional regulator ligand-binding domain-containing protein [Bauldia sp.]